MLECPDCLQQVEELIKNTGVCKQCTQRQINFKSRGKTYIPIKDLSEEEKQKVYNRRNGAQKVAQIKASRATKKKSEPTIIKRTIISDDNSLKEEESSRDNLVSKVANGDEELYKQILKMLKIDENEVRQRVAHDIEVELKRRNITLQYKNFLPLPDIISGLYNAVVKENYLGQYEPASKMFNDLLNDYQHQNENSKLENFKGFIENAIMENELLAQRRPIRNIVELSDCTEELFDYIRQDEKLRALLEKTNERIQEEYIKQQNPRYVSKASESILGQERVFEQKKEFKKRWDVSVPCWGLYGNKGVSSFRLANGAWAVDEEGAKEILRNTLRTRFSSVVYKDYQIKVTPWEDDTYSQKEGA